MRLMRPLIPALLGILGLACASTPGASPEARCRSYALPNNPDVVPPRLIQGPHPSPPQQGSGSGSVCVRATITESGSVVDPVVVQTDDEAFAAAFVSVLSSWRYEPATRGAAKVVYHAAIFARYPSGP